MLMSRSCLVADCKCEQVENAVKNPDLDYCQLCGDLIITRCQEEHPSGTHTLSLCSGCLFDGLVIYFKCRHQYLHCSCPGCTRSFGQVCQNSTCRENWSSSCMIYELAIRCVECEVCCSCEGIFDDDLHRVEEVHAGHSHSIPICSNCYIPEYYVACRGHLPVCLAEVEYGGKMYKCTETYKVGYDPVECEKELVRVKAAQEHAYKLQRWVRVFAQQKKVGLVNSKTFEYMPKLGRPCPNCAIGIRHVGGCWRMTCPMCYHSFWYPTGEDWNGLSAVMQQKYKGTDRAWWMESGNATNYWEPWCVNYVFKETVEYGVKAEVRNQGMLLMAM